MATKNRSPASNAEKKELRKTTVPSIDVRIQRLLDSRNVKAIASATVGGAFAVHGIKVIDSEKGLFVSMPQSSYKTASQETKYQEVFHPVTAEARTALNNAVLNAYEQAVTEAENETEDLDDSITPTM